MDKIKGKKNVAILVDRLYGGGAERVAGLLSVYLSSQCNVYFFLKDTTNIVYDYKGEIINVASNGYDYCEEQIRRMKKSLGICCSISFLESMNYVNIRTRERDHVIVSTRCTLSCIENPLYASMYLIERYFNYADAVVAVSQGVREELIEKYSIHPDKVITIYNFIQQDLIRYKASMTIDMDRNYKWIINIGRLDVQKNQLRLIRQFARLREKRSDVKLLIIGSGKEEAPLRNEIKKLNLMDAVQIHPYCKNPFAYLARANLYVMTSHYEGLPNALLEAMCLQIPIAAVDCFSGPRELLDDYLDYSEIIQGILPCKRGILIEDATSDDEGRTQYVCDAMDYLLSHEDYINEIKKNDKAYMDSYDNEHIMKQWEAVIQKVSQYPSIPYADVLDAQKITVIYGAGKLGRETLVLCQKKNIHVSAFLVADSSRNPTSIDNIPVIALRDFRMQPQNVQVLLGLGEKYYDAAVHGLLQAGYSDLHFVEFQKENEIICSRMAYDNC